MFSAFRKDGNKEKEAGNVPFKNEKENTKLMEIYLLTRLIRNVSSN